MRVTHLTMKVTQEKRPKSQVYLKLEAYLLMEMTILLGPFSLSAMNKDMCASIAPWKLLELYEGWIKQWTHKNIFTWNY